jgi:hypothetical protein
MHCCKSSCCCAQHCAALHHTTGGCLQYQPSQNRGLHDKQQWHKRRQTSITRPAHAPLRTRALPSWHPWKTFPAQSKHASASGNTASTTLQPMGSPSQALRLQQHKLRSTDAASRTLCPSDYLTGARAALVSRSNSTHERAEHCSAIVAASCTSMSSVGAAGDSLLRCNRA